MSRNATLIVLLVLLGIAMTVAGIAGRSAAPAAWMTDQRRSTLLYGPGGASAMAEVVQRFGVETTQLRRPLFHLGLSGPDSTTHHWIALLAIPLSLTETERDRVLDHLAQGGGMLLAGSTGLESCFGLRVKRVETEADAPPVALLLDPSVDIDAPDFVYEWVDEEDANAPATVFGDATAACEAVDVISSAPLLRATNAAVVAWRFVLQGDGTAILIANDAYLTNAALRETDAGAVVIPWLLDEHPTRVTFDEYHQGFQEGGSIFGATWRWIKASPVGWLLIQLAFAGLVALGIVAIRFGPTLHVLPRKRRSPLEHLSALAVGLERASGHQVAVQLMVNGLRRRLSRSGAVYRESTEDLKGWLGTLGVATRGKGTEAAIATLTRHVTESHNDRDVLETARAVEDVWNALRTDKDLKRS